MARGPRRGESDWLGGGQVALRAGRWGEARAAFERAVAADETPEAFEGLSWAAWWLDDGAVAIQARERAHRLYRKREDVTSAARMATWLAADHLDFHGAVAVAGGWLGRARRLLAPLAPGPEHGWLAFHEGYLANLSGETEKADALATQASELGRRLGLPDVEMLGLALRGSTLVARARVSEGMRCLDEATAMALAGEATIPISCAWACCFLVTACTSILDFRRAYEWCDRISEFAQRYGSRYMLAFCRAEYGVVYLWRGQWREAEQMLEGSLEDFLCSRPVMVAGPLVALAELRRRQGRAEESARLLDRAGASADVQLGRARLALDDHDPGQAVDIVERLLRRVPAHRELARVPALEVLVAARLARGEQQQAASALRALREIQERVGTAAMRASVDRAAGMLALGAGDPARARVLLEDAVDGFEATGAPFEAAVTRIELAASLSALNRAEPARRELERARASLRQLGATAAAEQARQALAPAADAGRQPAAAVSRRERDVLRLLAEGITNREIGKRLGVSEHTVHRHVTSILRKLDLPSRAAAAAHAVRTGLGASGEQ